MGKKNNQTLVCDADREIPFLWSANNAGNLVNLVSGFVFLPSGWDFLGLHRNRICLFLERTLSAEMKVILIIFKFFVDFCTCSVFLVHQYESTRSCHSDVSIGIGKCITLKSFMTKFFM